MGKLYEIFKILKNQSRIDSAENIRGNTVCIFKLPSSKPYFIFKAILEGYGIDASKIKIFEIENDPEMQAIQNHMGKITGGSTVPRIFIGGKFVGGCDEVNFSLFFDFSTTKF